MNELCGQRTSDELLQVNERLIISGVRNQELADQLNKQLAFSRAVTDSLDEGVCALDRDGRTTFCNTAATNLIDTPEAEVLGQNFHGLVHVDCGTDCPLRDALIAETRISSFQDSYSGPGEQVRPVSYSITPIVVDDERVGTVVAFRDITERKRLEQARELLLAHERTARSDAEAAVQIRSETLGTVTHDLRTPLTLVKGLAQRLLKHATNRATPDRDLLIDGLTGIESAAARMANILSELLDVAMLEEGKSLELRRSDCDLVSIVRDVVAQQQSLTNHRVVIDVPDEPLIGSWDRDRLERVLYNLLSNAVKFSPESSPITVKAWRADVGNEWAVIEIHDRGVGVPAADLPHIFTRYYRASNAKHSPSGIGLGLAGSKEIVEKHGGTIRLETTEGAGTIVNVRLPVSATVA